MKSLFNRNSQFKRSVFFKIFLSLMGLTLIPIFFLGLTSYFVFNRSIQTQSDNYDRLILRTMSEKVDRDLDEVKEILFRYALFINIEHDNYSRMLNVIRELGGIAGTSDIIKDIFIYLIDSDQVLTQNGIYTADVFFGKVYQYVDLSDQELYEVLKQQNSFRVVSTERVIQDGFIEKRYLTILNSVPVREKPEANLVVLVDESYFYSIMESAGFESEGSRIAIIKSSLALITGSVVENLDQEALKSFLTANETKNTSGVHNFRAGDVAVYSSLSEVTDWHYVVSTSVKQISRKAASIRNITLWVCAVSITVCFLLTWIISMKLYNPIREIVNTIKNEPDTNQDPGANTDEMSYILSHVKYVTERNRNLDNGLIQVEPTFKDHSSRSLTLGIPDGMISESASGFKLNWPYNHFTVVVVRISFNQVATPADNLNETMAEDFWRYFQKVLHSREGLLGVLTYIGKTQMTILVNLQAERTLGAFLQEVEPQIVQYADKYHCSISLGVGGFCKAMAQINESYEEALKALDSRNIKTGYQILYFNKRSTAPVSKSAIDYPAENERQLMNSVLAGDHDKVGEIINIIIANNLFDETTDNQLTTLFDRLIGTARKIIKKDRGIKQKIEEKKLLHDHSYNKPDTPVAVRRSVLEIYKQITEAFHHKRSERTPDLRERLIQYIQENYPVPDLSLDSIADEFGLNPKYVSRFFKEQTGTNYHVYLNKIRVKKSKELMVRGEKLKVQEISRMVGFYNVNTFITVFKRYEGITPNTFRKLPRV